MSVGTPNTVADQRRSRRYRQALRVDLVDKRGARSGTAVDVARHGLFVAIADALRRHRMDGVIATNTTLSREGVESYANGNETGGLSGAPVFTRSTAVQGKLAQALKGEVPIIGVGGILKGADAVEKMRAGASLVQFYSGFIYRGPELVSEVAAALANMARKPA